MYSKSVDEVTAALVQALKDQTAVAFKAVYYGDEDLHPLTPAVAVVVTRESELKGTNYRMEHTFNGSIVIYHSEMQDHQITRAKCNQQAEAIEPTLHKNQLNGLVAASWVTDLEPGYSARSEQLVLKSTELRWMARSVTYG